MLEKWAAGFKFAIGGFKYEPMPGGHVTVTISETTWDCFDIFHDVIMSGRRKTICYNANELVISRDRVDVAIHNALQMPKVLDCWVPKLF